MAISQNAKYSLIIIAALSATVSIWLWSLVYLCRDRERQDHDLEHATTNIAAEESSDDNPALSPPPPTFQRRQRVHDVYPRPQGWRPATLRSTPPRTFITYPALGTGTTPGMNGGGLSQPPDPPPFVGGGHPNCLIAAAARDGDYFVGPDALLSSSSLPSYTESGPNELPTYEQAAHYNGPPARLTGRHPVSQHLLLRMRTIEGEPSASSTTRRLELIMPGVGLHAEQ